MNLNLNFSLFLSLQIDLILDTVNSAFLCYFPFIQLGKSSANPGTYSIWNLLSLIFIFLRSEFANRNFTRRKCTQFKTNKKANP